MLRLDAWNVDCADPDRVAAFWQHALGWRRTDVSVDEVVLEPQPGSPERGVAPGLVFFRVPEPKAVKNRIHLDLRPDDRDAEVARLEALGATRVEIGQTGSESWVVLADPEGNEFCVLEGHRDPVDAAADRSSAVPVRDAGQ
jgi:predicted enzyme related to lactoylglutathione lyase